MQGQVDRARISRLPRAFKGELRGSTGVADPAARAGQEARAVKRITWKRVEVRKILTFIKRYVTFSFYIYGFAAFVTDCKSCRLEYENRIRNSSSRRAVCKDIPIVY